jgi:hypothetical protein
MTSLEGIQTGVGTWADKTFPSHHNADGTPNPRGPLFHLCDPTRGEVYELLRAFEYGQDLGEELADCAILLLTIAHLSGVNLAEAIGRKMTRNVLRKWGPPYANGICEHVKVADSARSSGATQDSPSKVHSVEQETE